MSLKLIEMQVALPRTVEASKLSEQLQQRGQIILDNASSEMKEQVEQNRHQVLKMERKAEAKLQDESKENEKDTEHQKHERQKKKKIIPQEAHPYKGKTIDYSG